MTEPATRLEVDLLGSLTLPADCPWGIHTERARRSFPATGHETPHALVAALADVKRACARANAELGALDAERAQCIEQACEELAAGRIGHPFPVGAFQGGAGTSTNLCASELIARRATTLLRAASAEVDSAREIGATTHVNLHQSTNDVYPTALKIALIRRLRVLAERVASLQGTLQKQEQAHASLVKLGRTELQEAVPMTLGAELGAFAQAFARDRWRTFKCEERLRAVNLGGTAIGTGLGAPRRYVFLVIERLRDVTGLGLSRGDDAIDQTANADVYVEVSAIQKALASNLLKVGNDLRLLNLLGEIRLEPQQAGSSIMPGKVNPVLVESAMSMAMRVLANDVLVSEAVSRSTLQICEFLPVVAHAMLESIELLMHGVKLLERAVATLVPVPEHCRAMVDRSLTLLTTLLPHVGYERATELARGYDARTGTVRQYLEANFGRELVEHVLAPHRLVGLGYDDADDA